MYRLEYHHTGGHKVPQDIRRFRTENMDLCRTMGQPIVWRHRFDMYDLESPYILEYFGRDEDSIACTRCPACYDTVYEQPRTDCRVCNGVTIVSVEEATDKWITEDGYLSDTDTGGLDPAPRYRGFGPSVLTWIVEPSTSDDIFKISKSGVLTRYERAEGYAPWYPEMNDQDIIINVDLDRNSGSIIDAPRERYYLSSVKPESIRGFGRMTTDRKFPVGQSFQMMQIERNHYLYQLEIDPT